MKIVLLILFCVLVAPFLVFFLAKLATLGVLTGLDSFRDFQNQGKKDDGKENQRQD